MFIAAKKGHPDVIHALVERGADPNLAEVRAMHIAASLPRTWRRLK